MRLSAALSVAIVLCLQGSSQAEPKFCTNGVRISRKYYSCWQQASRSNSYADLKNVTPEMLENYSAHMCTVVKPLAMDCLMKELRACEEKEKLLQTADESGGTCLHNELNPHFKLKVIDRLKPVVTDSECLRVGDASLKCVKRARDKVLTEEKTKRVGITRYHRLADKIFTEIWNCHIELFKSKSDVCENWQLPMLITIQKSALPFLFGMRLNNLQVDKLELLSKHQMTSSKDNNKSEQGGLEQKEQHSFLLMRLMKDRSDVRAGDVVLRLPTGEEQSGKFVLAEKLSVHHDEGMVKDHPQAILDHSETLPREGMSQSDLSGQAKWHRYFGRNFVRD